VTDIDTSAVAVRLADRGVPLEVISAALDRPIAELVRTVKHTYLTPEDEQLANAMRQLHWKVWAQAMWELENGHPDTRMAIMRVVLTKGAGLIGQESTSSFEESRAAVSRIFESMTAVDVAEHPRELPTPETSSYVTATSAAPGGAHHPGQEPEIDEDPLRPEDEQNWR
jgi:hypothetical protein